MGCIQEVPRKKWVPYLLQWRFYPNFAGSIASKIFFEQILIVTQQEFNARIGNVVAGFFFAVMQSIKTDLFILGGFGGLLSGILAGFT